MAPYFETAIHLLAQVLADDPTDPGDGDTGPPPGSPPRSTCQHSNHFGPADTTAQ